VHHVEIIGHVKGKGVLLDGEEVKIQLPVREKGEGRGRMDGHGEIEGEGGERQSINQGQTSQKT
jgi:hypothetical protein